MLMPKEVENAIIRIKKIETEIDALKKKIETEKITWQEERKLQHILAEYRKLRDEKKELEELIKEVMRLINQKK